MNLKKYSLLLSCALATFVIAPVPQAVANEMTLSKPAPDSSIKGPHQVASSEYHLAATKDPDIMDGITEIWAKVFYPRDITNTPGKAPLILFLHGNHGTCGTGSNPRHDNSCTYTKTGACPAGYVVTPNHEGYNYLAENLASWGYWVVSINANRGITCGSGVPGDYGLNLARGKLVLKHLSHLYKWATEGDAPASLGLGPDGLIDKIDFTSVGLFGHSRGGEGVRAAYNLYLDANSPWPAKIPDLHIKAIFEIGAVDGQTARVLDANGTVWNQLLPMCDGDVSDLEGRYPFERMLMNSAEPATAQKSLYEVWGANHNFFNTEWQESDSFHCYAGTPLFDPDSSGSLLQQQVALASVPAFFRSRLGSGPDPAFNQNFNPLDLLPETITRITQIDRDFTASPGTSEISVIEDFDQTTGINTSGNLNLSNDITIKHQKLVSAQRVAEITWKTAGKATFFEAVIEKAGQGRDLHDYATLDFRIGRINKSTGPTDFSIQLEDATGLFSNAISVGDYALINGPGNDNPLLKTVRIPLSVFQGIDLTHVHSIRFAFNKTETGHIYLGNIRAHKQLGLGGVENITFMRSQPLNDAVAPHTPLHKLTPEIVPANLNSIKTIYVVPKGLLMTGHPDVEIVVASQVPFPAMNSLPILQIGDKKFKLSRYSDTVALKELTFTLSENEYKTVSKTSNITVSNGKIWQFGPLAKATPSKN